MRITDKLSQRQTFSVELFPPKGDLPLEQAYELSSQIAQDKPDWISVTYSAGGSGSTKNTAPIAASIENDFSTTALAHLTCMGTTKDDVDAYVDQLGAYGVENLLALRGDRRPGVEPRDFAHASDMISYLRSRGSGLCVGAACYPEGHVESESLEADLDALYAKQEAGADFLVTQLFFDNEDLYRFREHLLRHRIKLPLVVGVMPFTSVKQVQRMTFNCGASIPARVVKRLVRAGDDPADQAQAGIEYACEQIVDLAANGVDGIHVYCMNKPQVEHTIHEALAGVGYFGK